MVARHWLRRSKSLLYKNVGPTDVFVQKRTRILWRGFSVESFQRLITTVHLNHNGCMEVQTRILMHGGFIIVKS
jgi:hypothetical protein